jgi:hypothetical protein
MVPVCATADAWSIRGRDSTRGEAMELWEQSIEARIASAREHVQRKISLVNGRSDQSSSEPRQN